MSPMYGATCKHCGDLHAVEYRNDYVCLQCSEIVDKNRDLASWILRVVEHQIDKAVREHQDKYKHEYSYED